MNHLPEIAKKAERLTVAGLVTVGGVIVGVLLGVLGFLAWVVDWGMDHFSVQYDKIPELDGVNLDRYRKKSSVVYSIHYPGAHRGRGGSHA